MSQQIIDENGQLSGYWANPNGEGRLDYDPNPVAQAANPYDDKFRFGADPTSTISLLDKAARANGIDPSTVDWAQFAQPVAMAMARASGGSQSFTTGTPSAYIANLILREAAAGTTGGTTEPRFSAKASVFTPDPTGANGYYDNQGAVYQASVTESQTRDQADQDRHARDGVMAGFTDTVSSLGSMLREASQDPGLQTFASLAGGGALTNALGGGVLGGAGRGALMSLITGGNPLTGALTGGAGAGLNIGLGDLGVPSSVIPVASNVISSILQGRDISLPSILMSASGGLGDLLKSGQNTVVADSNQTQTDSQSFINEQAENARAAAERADANTRAEIEAYLAKEAQNVAEADALQFNNTTLTTAGFDEYAAQQAEAEKADAFQREQFLQSDQGMAVNNSVNTSPYSLVAEPPAIDNKTVADGTDGIDARLKRLQEQLNTYKTADNNTTQTGTNMADSYFGLTDDTYPYGWQEDPYTLLPEQTEPTTGTNIIRPQEDPYTLLPEQTEPTTGTNTEEYDPVTGEKKGITTVVHNATDWEKAVGGDDGFMKLVNGGRAGWITLAGLIGKTSGGAALAKAAFAKAGLPDFTSLITKLGGDKSTGAGILDTITNNPGQAAFNSLPFLLSAGIAKSQYDDVNPYIKNLNSLMTQYSGNNPTFLKSLTDPYDQQQSAARGELQMGLGLRGLGGGASTFGNQSLQNFDTISGLGRADLLAKGTVGSTGVMSGLNTNALNAINARNTSINALLGAGLGASGGLFNQKTTNPFDDWISKNLFKVEP